MISLSGVLSILIGLLLLFFSIAFHEIGHALVADRLGDPTPRTQGRLSLNLKNHLDPIGTVLVPLALFFLKSPLIFGWAKPVQIDDFNLRHPKKDMALISLAGPGANLALAFLAALLFKLFTFFSGLSFLNSLFLFLTQINISLAIFNLLPVHPLDGGKILIGFLPPKQSRQTEIFLNRYGFLLLLLLILPIFNGQSLLGIIVSPVINFLFSLLIPSHQII
jgi:Zn-dependent protease